MKIPKSHPRHASLTTRNKMVEGVKKNITSIHGLIAHGRGEAFDYLIGEKTNKFAEQAISAAAAQLLLAKNPVISVNGNFAILCPNEIVKLSKIIPAQIEVNIFHASKQREKNIKRYLIKHDAKEVLLPSIKYLKNIDHNRKFLSKDGIAKADVVFVPLEDGDRCRALRKSGKKVITIDLNPLSRTAKSANITIVDNVNRAMPRLIEKIIKNKKLNEKQTLQIINSYNNKNILTNSLLLIKKI